MPPAILSPARSSSAPPGPRPATSSPAAEPDTAYGAGEPLQHTTAASPWWRKLLPGLVTGASDDDPSGIVTYSQVGAQFGLQMLWLMPFSYPLMLAAQLIAAQTGRVTGRGLGSNLLRICPPWLLAPLLLSMVLANIINIGADLGAMGAAATLVLGGPHLAYTIGFGVVSGLLQIVLPYSRYVRVLQWLTLTVFAYIAVVFVIDVPWQEVLRHTVWPTLPHGRDGVTAMVAVLGTTISPYLFFWQASQEVEEQRAAPGQSPLRQAPEQAEQQMRHVRQGTAFGMAVSNVVAFFVILTGALTLHAQGVHDIDSAAQAARALEPVAGKLGTWLFSLGILGTGLLAIPVLAGSAGYAVGEAMLWRTGLERRPGSARRFYAVIAVATLAGVGMNLGHLNPMKALWWSAVINGVIAVPILVALMVVATRSELMGEFTLSRPLRLLGWLTTAAMGMAALALLYGAA